MYWYQTASLPDAYEPLPLAERLGWYVTASQAAVGALEGEELKILERTAGNARSQDLVHFGEGWSGGSQLWWTHAKPGDRLTLAVPVSKSGKYKLTVQMTKAVDYGIVQLWFDNRKLGQPVDLYNRSVTTTSALDLGACELTAGEHRLCLEIVGANQQAAPGYMIGLDYVKLEALP